MLLVQVSSSLFLLCSVSRAHRPSDKSWLANGAFAVKSSSHVLIVVCPGLSSPKWMMVSQFPGNSCPGPYLASSSVITLGIIPYFKWRALQDSNLRPTA